MKRSWLGWASAALAAGRVTTRVTSSSLHAFEGQTVLVTGASGGIGEAVARLLAEHRARLVLVARSGDVLERHAEAYRTLGAEAHVFACDLAAPGAAEDLVARVHGAGLSVDVLVNNAGYGKAGTFDTFDAATYEDMIRLNCGALTALTRLLLPPMRQRHRGGILNVASLAAFLPVPDFAVYAATKAFVLSFTEALHAELDGSGVHVSCLCPGATRTGFFDRADVHEAAPFLRTAEPADVVARRGLEALLRNDRRYVSGPLNALAALATNVVPTRVQLAAGKRAIGKRTVGA